MDVLFFLVFCLTLVLFGYLVYLIYYSSLAKHFYQLTLESKKLEKDIILKRSQVLEFASRVDYYRNRLEDIKCEYVSKKINKNKKVR